MKRRFGGQALSRARASSRFPPWSRRVQLSVQPASLLIPLERNSCFEYRSFSYSSTTHHHDETAALIERTRQLLDPKNTLSVDDTSLWYEAEELFNLWLQRNNSDFQPLQRVDYCLRILNRLASLLPQGELLLASMFETDLLNELLLLWRHGVSVEEEPDDQSLKRLRRQLTPAFMTEKVDKYRWSCLIQPDVKTYNLILDGATFYPPRDGVQFSDSLLERLLEVAGDKIMPVALVDTVSISTVIHAWVQNQNPQQADKWLRRMMKWQDGTGPHSRELMDRPQPNTILYTAVISGWAKAGNAERATEILQQQLEDYQRGNSAAKPDTATFNAVLDAHAKSRNRNANTPELAETIVRQMQEYADNLDWNCAPDDYTWTTLISCHAKHSPKRAEELLESLEQTHVVSTVGYNAVMNAYAQAGQTTDATRILRRLLSSSSHAQPDEISYNTVLAAWAKTKSREAPRQAESLLEDMRHNGIVPSTRSYSSVLQCWAKSNEPGSAERAELWLQEMEAQSNPRAKPNTICYNIVLSAWGNVARITRDPQAVERAVRVLDQLLQKSKNSRTLQPTAVTFRAVLHAVAGSTVSRKGERAQALLQLMEKHGFTPNKSDKKLVRRLVSKRNRADANKDM